MNAVERVETRRKYPYIETSTQYSKQDNRGDEFNTLLGKVWSNYLTLSVEHMSFTPSDDIRKKAFKRSRKKTLCRVDTGDKSRYMMIAGTRVKTSARISAPARDNLTINVLLDRFVRKD